MPDCLFCTIVAKRIPAEIVYEKDAVLAFLDIHPRTPGHTVVVPKQHVKTLLDLDQAMVAPLFSAVQDITKRLSRALTPDGFTIGINHGKHAGQAIEHLHIHIMPRFTGDGGGSVHTVVDNPPEESIGEIAKKIRSNR